ncbi:MAG TPA: endonuclease/exonuclease/phosphatase family protein [Rhabdochlamydiaceae bacterium]|jgi:exonuclease III|nr:endonuclease/exonuclease/phosphatase family protein [Rhabdochlamydiaceae bacterium]
MSIDLEKSDSTAASWYRWHGVFSQPTYRVIEYFKRYRNPVNPSVLDNCSTRVREYAYRAIGPLALIGAAAFLAKTVTLPQMGLISLGLLTLEAGRTALHLLGFAAQKKNHLYVKGNLQPIQSENPKIMSCNVLGFPAGLNYTCGGTRPFRHRFPQIIETIRAENPDILIVQECLMDASVTEAFVNTFKNEYAHFFTHNGPNKWGLESGLLVMTKCPVTDYKFTPFNNNKWTFTRGFATLTIPAHKDRPAFAVIGTHMEAGSSKEDFELRRQQLDQINTYAQGLSAYPTVVLAGDLNIDASLAKEKDLLEKVLSSVNAPPKPPTCTNELSKIVYPNDKSPVEEWIDQISIIKKVGKPNLNITKLKIIPAYQFDGKTDSKKAFSDHNPIVAILNKA